MANRTVNDRTWHGTLTAGAEDVVTYDRDLDRWELLVAPGTTAPVYYTTDGTAATIPTTNSATRLGVVFPGSAVVETASGGSNSQIRLISADAAVYHITDASPR